MEIEILNEECLRAWCARIHAPAEGTEALVEIAQTVLTSEPLLRVFTGLHEQTAIRGEWPEEWDGPAFDPAVEAALGEKTSLFYLLAYMAALPYAEQEYHRRGIGMDIFDATMPDISFYYAQDSDVRNRWMFDEFPWIRLHLSCRLFRLGRLQFALKTFDSGVTAYRNKASGAIRLLADPALALRPDGCAYGAGAGTAAQSLAEPGESWLPVFEETADAWRGHLVSPYGYAMREPVTLPKIDWELALQRGDWVLDTHIPRGKTFTTQEWRESYRRGLDFFAWQHPERQIKAAYCHTWFFTPQLQQLLPAESHIVRFQREFYLYPNPGGPGFLWNFVFGERYTDPTTAPRDTSLRRAVLDWLAEGKELFDLPGVFFHSPEELGAQPYMTAWDRAGRNEPW